MNVFVSECVKVNECVCVCGIWISYSCFNDCVVPSCGPPPLSSISLLYGKWVLILKQIDLEISSRI